MPQIEDGFDLLEGQDRGVGRGQLPEVTRQLKPNFQSRLGSTKGGVIFKGFCPEGFSSGDLNQR